MGPDVPARPLTEGDPAPSEGAGTPPLRRRKPSVLREYGEVVLVAVVFALFVRTFLVQAFVVPTPSMENTVLVGDHLVVNKFIYAPHVRAPWTVLLPYRDVRRGDVFVFKFPEDPHRDFIKRVVALPGDMLEIRDKRVFVNGEEADEPRSLHAERRIWPNDPQLPESLRRRDQLPSVRIPADTFFAMGDNRDSSYDSRFWGPVPTANLKGRALFVYWSLAPPIPSGPSGLGSAVAGLFRRTRWARSFVAVR